MKRPTRPLVETLVKHWNAVYAIGIDVDLTEDDGTITRTKTRSRAWALGEHSAVVLVEGKSGGYDLTRITAVLPQEIHHENLR